MPNVWIAKPTPAQQRFLDHVRESALSMAEVRKLAPLVSFRVVRYPGAENTLELALVEAGLKALLPQFEKLTGVRFVPAPGFMDANLTVVLHGQGEQHLCIAQLPDARREVDVTIDIHANDERFVVDHCLLHELAHAFGLGHGCVAFVSVMCTDYMNWRWHRRLPAQLSRADELTLRVLYDFRLRRGLPVDEALPLLRRIVDHMWNEQVAAEFDGEIQSFHRRSGVCDHRAFRRLHEQRAHLLAVLEPLFVIAPPVAPSAARP